MKKWFNIFWIFCLILIIPVMCQAFDQWPDTGQTTSYTNTFGEDSDYSINPQSYTKLGSGGVGLSDTAISSDGWIMVKDNVTGLIWEVKTVDGSIHDKDNTYTWCDSNSLTNAGDSGDCKAYYNTEGFIDTLNSDSFGGFSDWRMPTINELYTIVNYNMNNLSFNTTFFPNTVSSYYWSSTTRAGASSYAWAMDFDGRHNYNNGKGHTYYVRAVRAGQSGSLDNLVDNGDGTVTDTSTGLMWQQNAHAQGDGKKTWESAITYCESLSLASHDDWRLPDINELRSLVDSSKYDPAIDTAFFPDTPDTSLLEYWSSTTCTDANNYAWVVNFYMGYDHNNMKAFSSYVRAVRSVVDIWYYDSDGDGYGDLNDSLSVTAQPTGYVADNTDCDDSDSSIHPGATEIAGDGIDQDCDGSDFNLSQTLPYADIPLVSGSIVTHDFYPAGNDIGKVGDLYIFKMKMGQVLQYYNGYSWTTTESTYLSAITLVKTKVTYDTSSLSDGDKIYIGYGVGIAGTYNIMVSNATFITAYTVPKQSGNTWYFDSDGDGYGDLNDSLSVSVQPKGYVANSSDCNDNDATIHPGAAEIAGDGIDQDCDGSDLTGSTQLEQISLLAPTDNETISFGTSGGKVTFSFSKLANAAKYKLHLNLNDILNDASFSIPVELIPPGTTSSTPGFSETFIGMVYELALDTATWDVLALYDIKWGVEAYDGTGSLIGSSFEGSVATKYINSLKFIASNSIAMTNPTLGEELSLAGSAPAFKWDAYQGVSTYALILAHMGSLGFDSVITKDNLTLNLFPMSDSTWQSMPTGTWYWTVLGYNSTGNQAPLSFTIFDFDVTGQGTSVQPPIVDPGSGSSSSGLTVGLSSCSSNENVTVDATDVIDMKLCITNNDGIAYNKIAQEWVVYSAIIAGVDTGLYFHTTNGDVGYTTSTDLSVLTYPFDHSSDYFSFKNESLSQLGLVAGDTFSYRYMYSENGNINFVDPDTYSFENLVVLTAK